MVIGSLTKKTTKDGWKVYRPTTLYKTSLKRTPLDLVCLYVALSRLDSNEPSFVYVAVVSSDDLDDLESFNYKVDTCVTDRAFEKLPRAFRRLQGMNSLDKIQRRMTSLSGVKPRRYDCCVNSCCCFTLEFAKLSFCPFCHEPRYKRNGKPVKTFSYVPLIPRLSALFGNHDTNVKLRYRADFKTGLPDPSNPAVEWDDITDIFDGDHYLRLLGQRVTIDNETLPHNFFSDERDVALGISFDGFCPFKRRSQTCWPIVAFNYNLPPEERFHLDNIVCLGVIPGPKQMKDANSFLAPLVEELLELARGVSTFDVVRQEIFALHAYLIVAFGDIPAVAKLMCMKGHNGRSPCRMCSISGIRMPRPSKSTTHYVPLSRPNGTSFDPLQLPKRTHTQFMIQARHVASARNDADEEALSMETGIKGIPILSCLSSLDFPTSFPYDFMHLIWENVVKTLANLWCGKFKGLDEGSGEYELGKGVWEAIGKACKASGDTIPSAFGCRVPNIATERSNFIAESWSHWCLYLGPVLLRKRFRRPIYYTHFVSLVSLLTPCLQFGMSLRKVDELRRGFADWVVEYERLVVICIGKCSLGRPRLLTILA